jgi:hypothetical protein
MRSATSVVVWQNESGTWRLHDDTSDASRPARLAGPDGDPSRSGDGPAVLLSPDGKRAVLGWQHEWDAIHDLLGPDGSVRRLLTRIPGFYLNSAALWLDSTRILFHIVASGPRGGEPTYRESGWRWPLALFDLRTDEYKIVVDVPELTRLRVAGPYGDDVLVTEWDTAGVRGHWVYDTKTWQRRAIALPKGRAFSSKAGAVVVYPDAQADTTDAILFWNGKSKPIGRVARDAEPAFSPTGRRGAIHTPVGVMLFESGPATP